MKMYITTNENVQELLQIYCDCKPVIWNLFFGWRGTKTINNKTYYYYLIPNKLIELVKTWED